MMSENPADRFLDRLLEEEPTVIRKIIHGRVVEACISLFQAGEYKAASHRAMTEVELALKEKSLASRKFFGEKLVNYAFRDTGAVTLHVPLGEDRKEEAKGLLQAAFKYYRNYAAHDGSLIDAVICFRILSAASELLDLLDVSARSLSSEGGVEALVEQQYFLSVEDFFSFLKFMEYQWYLESDPTSLLADLADRDYDWSQVTLLQDFGLLEETSEVMQGADGRLDLPIFEISLTEEGRRILESRPHVGSRED